ncbi:MAG: DUF1461 domain-containing protein, partial [Chloroflexi bacterium]|nr:DUF1461 domain-containing protein [Chloroflexota bacterium]
IGCSWITWVIGPAYPSYEYAKPDFSPDLDGIMSETAVSLELVPLTQTERLELALVAVAYLESWQPAEAAIDMLALQKIPHTGAPFYNQRELSHMIDVKQLTDTIRWMALVTAVLNLGGLVFLLVRPQTRQLAYLSLGQGGLVTFALLTGLTAFILFGWGFFFYQFHGLLFSSGSWSFAATDGLMRLYPERFFFDVGVLISGGALLWGGVTTMIGYLLAWASTRFVSVKASNRGTHVQKAIQ